MWRGEKIKYSRGHRGRGKEEGEAKGREIEEKRKRIREEEGKEDVRELRGDRDGHKDKRVMGEAG